MEDFERYGDYNDIDDEEKSRSIAMIVVKILTAAVCLSVVGVLVFRMILFSYYPAGTKRLVFDAALSEYYNATGGDIRAKTQDIRFPYDNYDDPSDDMTSFVVGNFFADNLIIVEGVDQLQLSVRFNTAVMKDIAKRYGIDEPSADDEELLSFRLYDNYGRTYDSIIYSERYSFLMYRYYKLVFDGVELSDTGDGKYPEWISLEIFVGGREEVYSYIIVYENNEDFSSFSDYRLASDERPEVAE